MRLGIGSYTYTWAVGVPGHAPERPLSADGLLDRAVELGVGVVQLADNLPLDRLEPAAFESFARRAADLSIVVETGTRGIGLDHLRAYLALARRLNSPVLRTVCDTADQQPTPDEIVYTLREFAVDLEDAGICLAVENHDRFTAALLANIVARIGSPFVGICLDTVNSFGALEGPETVVGALGPLTVDLHVKDFAVERAGHKMGFSIEGRPAGQGRLNVPWLLNTLQQMGRDPNAILELWTPPEPSLSATIAREDAWARSSIAYLKQYIPA